MNLRHARPHVRKFWSVQNRKVIGLSMVMFGIAYSIGFVFTVILSQYFIINILNILIMWASLLLLVAAVTIGGVITSHYTTSQFLSEREHTKHSQNIGVFLILMSIGSVVFALPLLLAPRQAMLLVLFTLGGIMMLLYVSISVIFGYGYHEIGFASILMWVTFVAGASALMPSYTVNMPMANALAFLLTSITIITVFSITGVYMLYRTSSEFVEEFKAVNRIKG